MKTSLKKLSKFILVGLLILTITNAIHAGPNGKKEKKAANLYKKNYITHPLFILAMHNGENYAFINSNRKDNHSMTKTSITNENDLNNKSINSVKTESTSNDSYINISNQISNEAELKFEDWMISSFDTIVPVDKELKFEDWMTDEDHWKLSE